MTIADDVYDALGVTFQERAGALLRPVIDALTGPVEDVDDHTDPTPDGGWARVFDLDLTPAPGMLGAATGTPIPAGLTLEESRAFLRTRPGRSRGTAAAITAAAKAAAPGRRVEVLERVGSPWALEVRIIGGAPAPAALAAIRAAIEWQKPVGIKLTIVQVAGASYDHLRLHHGTYDQLATEFPTGDDQTNHQPETGTTP